AHPRLHTLSLHDALPISYKPIGMSIKIMPKRPFSGPVTAFAVTLCSLAMTTIAGPFDKALVASDAKWVVHLDVEAFRASKLGGRSEEHTSELQSRENLVC